MSGYICIVGAFPPPVHGMAAVNAAVLAKMESVGLEVGRLDLSSGSLARDLRTRARKVQSSVCALFRFYSQLVNGRIGVLYVGLSGGPGLFLEMVFVVLARLWAVPVFLHHHSFAYLDRHSIAMWVLVAVAGGRTRHVVLCECMKKAFSSRYVDPTHVLVVPNAAWVNSDQSGALGEKPGRTLDAVGFLGNVCEEKGIFEFLEFIETCAHEGLHLKGFVAGPFQDRGTECRVRARMARLENVEYVGPKYGPEKREFLSRVGALVFPTKYVNEAEPLVVLEALAAGIPILAADRGCIKEIVPEEAGVVRPLDGPFVRTLVTAVSEWVRNPDQYARTRTAARMAYERLREHGTQSAKGLEAELMLALRGRQ